MAAPLYDATCFFKSQKKRDPKECGEKVYALWCGWGDAYPGQNSTKLMLLSALYRIMCICKYHMAGRVNEESTEAFNSVFGKNKECTEVNKNYGGEN